MAATLATALLLASAAPPPAGDVKVVGAFADVRVRGEHAYGYSILTVRNRVTGVTERLSGAATFVLIGAGPHTTWLPKAVQRDERGYVLTDRTVARDVIGVSAWPEAREPYALETSLPGVFAAGDVRQGSPRRVATAVADGVIAIRSVREYLAV